jgi:uncharacterized protein YkwD
MPFLRSTCATVAAVVAVLILLPSPTSAAPGCGGAGAVPSAGGLDRASRATLCLLNRVRASHGLAPLRADARLRAAARRYARHMVRHRFFGHVSAVTGSTLTSRVRSSGFLRGARAYRIGENIAWGAGASAAPRRIVRAWMRSPGHRANILDRSFRRVGVGIALGSPRAASGPAATYATDFGARR